MKKKKFFNPYLMLLFALALFFYSCKQSGESTEDKNLLHLQLIIPGGDTMFIESREKTVFSMMIQNQLYGFVIDSKDAKTNMLDFRLLKAAQIDSVKMIVNKADIIEVQKVSLSLDGKPQNLPGGMMLLAARPPGTGTSGPYCCVTCGTLKICATCSVTLDCGSCCTGDTCCGTSNLFRLPSFKYF